MAENSQNAPFPAFFCYSHTLKQQKLTPFWEWTREYLKGNRKSTAKEVVAGLAAKGIKVNEGLVYVQKGMLKGKRQRRAKVIRAARAAQATSSNGNPVVLIRDVKALAVRAGGYKMLTELVEALGE